MRASFEFDLPDERGMYRMHSQAFELHDAIWEYAQWLRGICKHGDPTTVDASKCKDKLHELLNERNVDIMDM